MKANAYGTHNCQDYCSKCDQYSSTFNYQGGMVGKRLVELVCGIKNAASEAGISPSKKQEVYLSQHTPTLDAVLESNMSRIILVVQDEPVAWD